MLCLEKTQSLKRWRFLLDKATWYEKRNEKQVQLFLTPFVRMTTKVPSTNLHAVCEHDADGHEFGEDPEELRVGQHAVLQAVIQEAGVMAEDVVDVRSLANESEGSASKTKTGVHFEAARIRTLTVFRLFSMTCQVGSITSNIM